jgi:ribosomal protein S18 acetylase RimI-like enzyme
MRTPVIRIERHLYGVSAARDAELADVVRAVFIGEGHSPPEIHAVLGPEAIASRGITWIALAGDAIAGTVVLVNADNRFRQVAVPPEAELHLLAVARAHRGRGAAKALVTALVDHARGEGVPALVLSTQPHMIAAHALYAKAGFTRAPHRDWRRGERSFWVFEKAMTAK